MPIELTRITVKNDMDILRLHELSLQVAGWAGLSSPDQICFAVNVSNHYFNLTEGEEVAFSIYQKKGNRFVLKAEMKNKGYVFEKELAQPIHANSLPDFSENILVAKNQWERYRDMQQFTFALAHDLKNSLTKLKLSLSLVEEEEMPPIINNYIQIIHRSADRLETVMLSLNKIIELGDASPDVVKKISPEKIFTDVYDEFNEVIIKNGAFINTDFTNLHELNYIEVYLKSIFSNLLSNAIKYASTDRPLHLSVTGFRDEDKAVFVFTDNGQGIDLTMHGNKIFLPFTRFSNHIEGSGIGLYLIKNMVERNGGSIEVESTPAKGTTFRVIVREYKLPI